MKNMTGRKVMLLTLDDDPKNKGRIIEDWYDEDTNERFFRVRFPWVEEKVYTETGLWKNLGIIS